MIGGYDGLIPDKIDVLGGSLVVLITLGNAEGAAVVGIGAIGEYEGL